MSNGNGSPGADQRLKYLWGLASSALTRWAVTVFCAVLALYSYRKYGTAAELVTWFFSILSIVSLVLALFASHALRRGLTGKYFSRPGAEEARSVATVCSAFSRIDEKSSRGKVFYRGEIWSSICRSPSTPEKGDEVLVTSRDGLTLVVEPRE